MELIEQILRAGNLTQAMNEGRWDVSDVQAKMVERVKKEYGLN